MELSNTNEHHIDSDDDLEVIFPGYTHANEVHIEDNTFIVYFNYEMIIGEYASFMDAEYEDVS